MEQTPKLSDILLRAGLPPFELAPDGYPLPGKVIKYYREQMKYKDSEGIERHWTQADLAQVLGLKETMVNLMENKNQGLDSIERRRTLAAVLKIPPILLGLGSLDQIVEIVTGQDTTQTREEVKQIKVTEQDIAEYKKTLRAYSMLFTGGVIFNSIKAMENTIGRIYEKIQDTPPNIKNELLRILWDFELLCAKIYGSDSMNWQKTFEHIDNVIELAAELDNSDLKAISLYTSGLYHLRQGRIGRAKIDIEGALYYAKTSLSQTKGVIFTLSSWYHEKTNNMFMSQKIYEEAEEFLVIKDETAPINFGRGTYLIGKGELFLHMNRPVKALEYLDDAEQRIGLSQKRLHAYLDIVRAKCYAKMKKPEYEQSANMLRKAIYANRQILVVRNMKHIEKLYQQLRSSSYGNSPDIIELGQEIQELKLLRNI